jgi:SAM-dependent methyltransferase
MNWLRGLGGEIWFAVAALAKVTCAILAAMLLISAVLTAYHYPRSTDLDASAGVTSKTAAFYESSYGLDASRRTGLDYESVAREAAEKYKLEPTVRQFVEHYGLQRGKVLDVGSGRGYLQDVVEDYTGLDLSSEVARHYHKQFVAGSAFDLPFPANSFDALWTVWVVEHLNRPERAFREMRRVVKNGGILLLFPTWNCERWLSGGYAVRPYSDFTLPGKLVKASIPVRQSLPFQSLYRVPVRLLRSLQYRWGGSSTPLQFVALQPNYEVYWQPDSDAAISLDSYEAYLWFRSKGDECLNCDPGWRELREVRWPMVIRVRK